MLIKPLQLFILSIPFLLSACDSTNTPDLSCNGADVQRSVKQLAVMKIKNLLVEKSPSEYFLESQNRFQDNPSINSLKSQNINVDNITFSQVSTIKSPETSSSEAYKLDIDGADKLHHVCSANINIPLSESEKEKFINLLPEMMIGNNIQTKLIYTTEINDDKIYYGFRFEDPLLQMYMMMN